jgi:galactitol PTS system EIIC component
MNTFTNFLDLFFSFKPYVMLPIFMLIIGLVVRMKVSEALMSALKLAVGFAGIFIVFSYFVENIKPAVEAITVVRGLDFPILDVGWPPLAAITWGSPIAPVSILLIISINIIMLATNRTKTIYIDMWNFWHLALAGAFVLSVTNNFILGLITVTVITVYNIKTADWTAPHVEREEGLSGVTISPISVVGLVPFSVTMDYLYDRIPWFNKLNYNPEKGNGKVGLLSEPMIIGVIIGILLGLAAGYSVKLILELSIQLAAVMFLLPQCGGLIGQGIGPVSQALKVWIQHRFPKKKELYVAVNSEILMSNKSVMITGLLLMPLALIIALLIPGNKVLPLGDLPNLISVISVTVLISRGNVIRSVITGIPIVATYLLISTRMAPMITKLSEESGMTFGNDQLITAFTDGGNHVRFYLLHLFQGNIIAIAIIPIVLVMMYFSYRRSIIDKKALNGKK